MVVTRRTQGLLDEDPETVLAEGEVPQFNPEGYLQQLGLLTSQNEELRKQRERQRSEIQRLQQELEEQKAANLALNRGILAHGLQTGFVTARVDANHAPRDELVLEVRFTSVGTSTHLSADQVVNASRLGKLDAFSESIIRDLLPRFRSAFETAVSFKIVGDAAPAKHTKKLWR